MLVLRAPKKRNAWLHAFIAEELRALALVQDSISHQDFVKHLTSIMPRGEAARDQREFMAVRALKRMVVLGTLPCKIEGDRFILP